MSNQGLLTRSVAKRVAGTQALAVDGRQRVGRAAFTAGDPILLTFPITIADINYITFSVALLHSDFQPFPKTLITN